MSELRNQILVGDVRTRLAEIPRASIDCVITSPPYFQLREYGVSGQLGLEQNVSAWADELRLVARGLARVLKPTGSLWLNLGDSYSRHSRFGAPRKSLMLSPERLLLGLAEDGWITRNKVIWAKTNPMPYCVADRLSNSYDVVYFLTRSPSYFFDLDAIRPPYRSRSASRTVGRELGKNPGDVWPIASASFRGAHFATFPLKLIERPLLASCPERICIACEVPHRRASHARREQYGRSGPARMEARVLHYSRRYRVIRRRGPLRPACTCDTGSRPGLVLDPFMGSGTVALAAIEHQRDWLGVELNPAYAAIAQRRIDAVMAQAKTAA